MVHVNKEAVCCMCFVFVILLAMSKVSIDNYSKSSYRWQNIRASTAKSPVVTTLVTNKITSTEPARTASSTTETPETVTEDWAHVAGRFKTRLLRMQAVCKSKPKHHIKHWKPRTNFLVDVPRRLLVCAVPKSGSTSWHRLFWAIERRRRNLSEDPNLYGEADTQINKQNALNLRSKDGQQLITPVLGDTNFSVDPPKTSSFRVILVRHPFARFISGWNQKFLLNLNYWVSLMKTFPKLIQYKKEIDTTRVFSFTDFARFAAENQDAVRVRDPHFTPATYVCAPCEYDFTYVVKAESIDADDRWLMNRIGLSDFELHRHGTPPGGSVVNNNLKKNIQKYMSRLSSQTVRGLYELYREDFEMFGYTFDFNTLEAGGFD